jgi:phage tail-like protein
MQSKEPPALLRITHPDKTEQVISITKTPFDIGRVPSNDLQLSDEKVSRHHARLVLTEGGFHLIDRKSSNGIIVGQTRLKSEAPYLLSYHQAFRIGPYTLRLEAVSPSTGHEVSDAELAASHHAPRGVLAASPPSSGPPSEAAHDSSFSDPAFGLLPESSRYLQYLPPIYAEAPIDSKDQFLILFLRAFEGVLTPIEQIIDNFDLYLDAQTAPLFFLDQLAAWLGLTLDEKWPEAKRRTMVAEAARLYERRGTRWSLSRHLEIYTGVRPEIIEPESQPHHFEVVLRLPAGHPADRATMERIIQANKPAHTTYSLQIMEV